MAMRSFFLNDAESSRAAVQASSPAAAAGLTLLCSSEARPRLDFSDTFSQTFTRQLLLPPPRRRCRCRGCHAALLSSDCLNSPSIPCSICSTYSEGGGGHRSIRKGRLIAVTSPPRLSVSGRDVRRSHESLNPPPPRARRRRRRPGCRRTAVSAGCATAVRRRRLRTNERTKGRTC